jgi:hypothetical protein
MFPICNPLLLFLGLSMGLKLPIIEQNGKFSEGVCIGFQAMLLINNKERLG